MTARSQGAPRRASCSGAASARRTTICSTRSTSIPDDASLCLCHPKERALARARDAVCREGGGAVRVVDDAGKIVARVGSADRPAVARSADVLLESAESEGPQ
jgi:hypothetical protein